MEENKLSFPAAAKEFFGYRPGQGLRKFNEELKQLTPKDKQEIAEGLRAIGLDCKDPAPLAPIAA